MPDSSGSVDLSSLSAEEKAAVEDLAAKTPGEPEPEVEELLTAFLVLVGKDGNPSVQAVSDPRFTVLAQPTPDLVTGAAQVLIKDFTAQEAALATAEVMQQQAMAMQQRMQEQMLQRQVAEGLKKPGGRV